MSRAGKNTGIRISSWRQGRMADSKKRWRRGCLGKEWRWDHWERAEVLPKILREKGG